MPSQGSGINGHLCKMRASLDELVIRISSQIDQLVYGSVYTPQVVRFTPSKVPPEDG
ncbi:MAG: hypothetical protein UT84_C0017G0010 [Candidatus Curtissbacteria bacterium GW2011_GWA1_40_16]|uniref:Uncharacterized protein n=1 Tax=Candidatus Curtissbacteria bacterium GW2011_GWA1_40_16 TaxID=1618405 RepID=A0A0G0UIC6_9BACT|nr:MAG: hypothetical protein UT84_C0017G0010 [Candidatus Curtissbacteria bacterium GW2011_GWA1_40_16]